MTLAVAAIESLPPGSVPETLHLVGDGVGPEEWAFREALGWPQLQLRRHAAGAGSFFAALADAARPDGPSDEVVVGVGLGNEVDGGGAVAFRLSDAAGVAVLGHRTRGHPDWKRPDGAAWSDAGRSALGAGAGVTAGELFLVSPAAAPVLLQRWSERMPTFPVVTVPSTDPSVGDSSTLRAALAVHDGVVSRAPGSTALIAVLEPGRSTSFVGIRVDAPSRWTGDWSGAAPGTERARLPASAAGSRESISQGAYVPRATYLAELPSRWRFAADRCGKCGRVTFPLRSFCRHCGAAEPIERIELPRRHLEVLATTTVAPGAQPTEFDPQVERNGAYDVVLVALGEGVRATLQVADMPVRTLKIGDRVDTQLRRLYETEGEWRYGLKAVRSGGPPTG